MKKFFIFILAAFISFGARADKWDDLLKDVYKVIGTTDFQDKIKSAPKEVRDAHAELLNKAKATKAQDKSPKKPEQGPDDATDKTDGDEERMRAFKWLQVGDCIKDGNNKYVRLTDDNIADYLARHESANDISLVSDDSLCEKAAEKEDVALQAYNESCKKHVEWLQRFSKELENQVFLSSTIYNDKVVYFFCEKERYLRMATDGNVLDNECKQMGDGVQRNQLYQIGAEYIVCEGNKFVRNANGEQDMKHYACKHWTDRVIHYQGAEFIQCKNGRYVGQAASPNFTPSDAILRMLRDMPNYQWNCRATNLPNKFICITTSKDGSPLTYEVILTDKIKDEANNEFILGSAFLIDAQK